jgi:hypothetical protein
MSTMTQADLVGVDSQKVDADGFIKLWDLAACKGDGEKRSDDETRELAGKLLGFLCKLRYENVLVTQHAANYLQDRFERNEGVLFNWSPDTDNIDLIAQHIEVPAQEVVKLLAKKRFDPQENYNPRRSSRLEWFNNDWKVG